MVVPAEYVAAVVVAMAGVIATLFRMYVSSQRALLSEKEEKVRILQGLKDEVERRRGGTGKAGSR